MNLSTPGRYIFQEALFSYIWSRLNLKLRIKALPCFVLFINLFCWYRMFLVDSDAQYISITTHR